MTDQTSSFAAALPSTVLGATWGALTVLCWASYNVAAVQGLGAGLHPIDLSLLRFGSAGFVLVPVFFWLRRRDRDRTAWPTVRQTVALAILGGPVFGMLAVGGYAFAPLSHGMVFAPAAVFVVGTALAAVVVGERIRRHAWLGGLVILTGLAVLSGAGTGGSIPGPWKGALLFTAAGTMWAGFTVAMRYWYIDPLRGTLAVGVVSALLSPLAFGAALIAGASSGLTTTVLTAVAFQAVMQGLVGGVLSVVALMAAARHLDAATVALLPSFAPVAALALAIPALGDRPDSSEAIGVGIAVLGLIVAAGRSG